MAIPLYKLENAADRARTEAFSSRRPTIASLSEEVSKNIKTAFLCHSHKDDKLAEGLQEIFRQNGLELYIDWKDGEMPKETNKETAERIRSKIIDLDLFIFLATPNSTESKWCPWEIGYADAKKFNNDIIIVATIDQSGNFYGNEYLRLYRQISETTNGAYALYEPGVTAYGTLLENVSF